jgi:hypothetical protein
MEQNELIFKEDKQADGYWYRYFVDADGKKQGLMEVFFPNIDTGEITDIKHCEISWKDDKYNGMVLANDREGKNFLETYFQEHALHGQSVLSNDKGDKKEIVFIGGKRIS